ncbi:MAG: EF-hand domain-containing protein [Candidatus Margulisiibacteriota bacterium]
MVNGINNAGDLNRVFNKYDKNNDGKITRDEVVRTNAECATDTDEITSSDFNQIAPLGDDASSISISELEVAGLKPAIDAKIIAYKQAVDAYKANPTTENQTKVETALRGYNEISGNQPNPAVTAIRQEYEAFERPLSQIRDAWSSADLIAVYQRNKAAIDSQPALRSALEARVKERYQSVSGQDPGNFTSNGLNQILSGEITAQNLPDKIAHIIPVDPRVVIFLSDQLNGQQALSILSNGIYASNPQVSRVLADRIELKDNQRLLVFSHQGITSAVVVETNNLPSTPNTSVSQMLQVRWNVVGGRLPQGVEIHPTSGNGEPVFSGNAILIRRGPQATIPTAIPSAPPTPRLPRGIIITANPTNGVIPIDIKQPLLNREASHSIYHNRIISSGHEIIGAGRILVYSSNQFVVDNNEGRTTGISQNRFDNLSSPMQVYDKAGNPTGEEIPKGASVVMLGTRVLFARINNQIHYYGDQEYYAGPAPSGRNSGRVIFSGTSDTRPNLLTMVRSGAETILGRAIASVRSTIRNNHIETISNKQYLVPNGAVITRDNGAVRSIRLPANSSSTMAYTVQEDDGAKPYTLRAGESLYFNASGQPTHMGSTTATTQFNTAATRAVFAPATREDATIPVRPGASSLPPGLTFASQTVNTSRGLIDSQTPPPNGTHNVTAQGRILVYNAQNKVAVYNVLPGDKVTIESGKVVSITRGTSTYTFAGNDALIDTLTPALLQPGQAAPPTVVAQQPPPPAGPTTDSEGVTVYSSKPQGAVLAGLTTGSVIRVAGGQEFAVVNNNGQKELVGVTTIHRRPDASLASRMADGLYYNVNDKTLYQIKTTEQTIEVAVYNSANRTTATPIAATPLPGRSPDTPLQLTAVPNPRNLRAGTFFQVVPNGSLQYVASINRRNVIVPVRRTTDQPTPQNVTFTTGNDRAGLLVGNKLYIITPNSYSEYNAANGTEVSGTTVRKPTPTRVARTRPVAPPPPPATMAGNIVLPPNDNFHRRNITLTFNANGRLTNATGEGVTLSGSFGKSQRFFLNHPTYGTRSFYVSEPLVAADGQPTLIGQRVIVNSDRKIIGTIAQNGTVNYVNTSQIQLAQNSPIINNTGPSVSISTAGTPTIDTTQRDQREARRRLGLIARGTVSQNDLPTTRTISRSIRQNVTIRWMIKDNGEAWVSANPPLPPAQLATLRSDFQRLANKANVKGYPDDGPKEFILAPARVFTQE